MTVAVIGCLWFSFIPTAHGFASTRHHSDGWGTRMLIDFVHDEHWDIAYTFGEDCPEERRVQTKELEAAITLALQTWLQPLREIETQAPIVNEFRFHQVPELTFEALQKPDLAHLDLGVIDTCEGGRSKAGGLPNLPPRVFMRVGENVTNARYISTLIHEIGHTIGLGDIYVDRPHKPAGTKGGLNATVGTQPASVMAGHLHTHTGHHLSEDDIW